MKRWLDGGGFPVFVLSTLGLYWVLLAAVVLLPATGTPLEAFADELRRWCFGAGEQGMDPIWVAAMLCPPWVLGAFVTLVWWAPLRAELRRPVAILRHAAPSVPVVAMLTAALLWVGAPAKADFETFPADSLRTEHAPPPVQLTDQEGDPVDLAKLRGEVVLVTAVYAHCVNMCPGLLTQVQRVVDGLPPSERDDVTVLAITLDPVRDDVEGMKVLATRYGMEAPTWRLLTGEPERVERTLDLLGFARQRDPETGMIDHTGLVLVVDREGRIAWRLGTGDRQERWLGQAVRLALAEEDGVG